jgi:hypothetical protein
MARSTNRKKRVLLVQVWTYLATELEYSRNLIELDFAVGPLKINFREFADSHEAGLAGESERLIAALRLGDTEDPVIAGVVHRHLLTVFDRQSPPLRKYRVAKSVLRAYGTRSA